MKGKGLRRRIRIGKIKEEDKEEAYRFCLGIIEEMGWEKKFFTDIDNLPAVFKGEREIFLLAKEEDKIIGCVGLNDLSEKQALMRRFYVAKEFRGKGLAPKLFKRIKKFAKEKNYSTIVLDVFKNNFRAKRFYQKQGFIPFKPRPQKKWPDSKYPNSFDFRKFTL